MERRIEPVITVDGHIYRYASTLKADFFSANHLYEREGVAYVLKVSRFRFVFAPAFQWLARLLHSREWAVYSRLDGVPRIPRLAGRWGRDAYLHDFIPGNTLRSYVGRLKNAGEFDPVKHIRDDFFPKLQETIAEVHRREVGYADLSKSDNVIVDENGEPWLIDFQISWPARPSGPLRPLSHAVFRAIAREDLYHVLKFKARYRPDQLTAEERVRVAHPSGLNRFHKYAVRIPFLFFKRMIYPKGSNEIARWKSRKPGARE